MPEPMRRFDLLGWLTSASFTLLMCAIALSFAVHLIASIWAWLVAGLAVIALVVICGLALSAWYRRQQW